MRAKLVIPLALMTAVLGGSSAWAQDYLRARESPDVPSATQAPLLPPTPTPIALPPVTGPDSYITYSQPCCQGPVGGSGPITYELFVRTGPYLPVSGSFLNHFMVDGWMVQGGGRSLFYNVDRDKAWTVEIGLSQTFNQGRNNMWLQLPPKKNVANPLGGPPINLPGDVDTVDLFQQTLADLGFGREWYLIGAAYEPGKKWRIGADGGGIWGVANISYHNFNPLISSQLTNINFGQFDRRSHVAGGCFTALHTDFECPCNCCTFVAGFRAEWSYTTTRVLVDRDNGIFWVNFLMNFGVRF